MSRKKGQRSSARARRDDIAEKLIEVRRLAVDLHEANLVHAKAQLTRLRSLGELLAGIDGSFREERADELAEVEAEHTAARERSRLKVVA